MAYRKINNYYYQADTAEDLKDIDLVQMGLSCYVIKEACEYEQMSTGEWVRQVVGSTESAPSEANYVTAEELEEAIAAIKIPSAEELMENCVTADEMKEAIAAIEIPSTEGLVTEDYIKTLYVSKDVVDACYRPIKYEVTSLPKGSIVDYRDKEIRVFCPENVEFTKQNVGVNGNANMYYMTFRAYAPEGAVSFKEGDRGVIIDEMFDFNSSAAGTDKYGRKYSVCWLALATYSEETGAWTYFGATSNTSKYIGWTYCVEWYDINGDLIGADKIRINLSNADCHFNLEPYFG